MTRGAAAQAALLGAWLGAALLVATTVAPAAFRVLPSRTLAGAMVGQVLPVIFISGLATAGISWLADRPAPTTAGRVVLTGLATMAVACAVAQFAIAPKIESIREAIGGPLEGLEASDPRRIRFGQLHGISVALMGVAMLAAASALLSRIFSKSP